MEPISVLTTIGSSLNATVNLANVISALKNTPEDVKACLVLVEQVNTDLQFLVTLRNRHLEYLSRNPEELQRIDRIVFRSTEGLLEIGKKLERCRKDANGGKTPMMGRFMWVIGDSASFVKHSAGLAVLQAGIIAEMTWLRNLSLEVRRDERLGSTSTNYETKYENEDMFFMDSGKKRTRKEVNLLDFDDAPPSYQDASQRAWSTVLIPDSPSSSQSSQTTTGASSTKDFTAFTTYAESEWQQYPSQSTYTPRSPSSYPPAPKLGAPRAATPRHSFSQLNHAPNLSSRASFSQSTSSLSSSPCLTPLESAYSEVYPPWCAEPPTPETCPAVPARPGSTQPPYAGDEIDTRYSSSRSSTVYNWNAPPPVPAKSAAVFQYPPIPAKIPIIHEPSVSIRELPNPSCSSDSIPTPGGDDEWPAIHVRRPAEVENPEDALFSSLKIEEIDRERRRRLRVGR